MFNLKKTYKNPFIQIVYPFEIIGSDFGIIFNSYIKEKIKKSVSYNVLKENNYCDWSTKIFVDNIDIFIDFLFTNLTESKAFKLNLPRKVQKSSSKPVLIPTVILWNTISDYKIGLSMDPIDYKYEFSIGFTKEKYQLSIFYIQKIR